MLRRGGSLVWSLPWQRFCPGAGWLLNEKPLPPDRLQKQIVGLTDRVFVCASQSAAAVNNIALLSSAMVSLSADREAYGPEEAARWLRCWKSGFPLFQHHPPAMPADSRFGRPAYGVGYHDSKALPYI